MKFLESLFIIASLFIKSTKPDTECPSILNPGENRISHPNKDIVRLMQFNVEWFFIDYYSSADCPGNGCPWHNSSEANVHMNYISSVIATMQPDILNICEIEGCDELNSLNEVLNKNYNQNSYNYFLKKGTDTSTGQNVGLLTKINPNIALYRTEEKLSYPIPDSQCGCNTTGTTGVSKHYITEFTFPNSKTNVAFIAAHLLAIPTDPCRCSQREVQAQIMQNVIYSYVKNNYEIIFIGDLNDYDNEVLDVNNNIPTSMVLDILKGIKGSNSGKYRLHNAANSIPQQKRYSDWWDPNADCKSQSNEFSMIDHILVSSNLLKKIDNVFIYQAYEEFCGKYNSDHYPLIVDFIGL